MKYLILIMVGFLIMSCQQQSEHSHDADGNHLEDKPSENIPRTDYTIWSNKIELFVEFPVLIVGLQSRFAAHFTAMNKHQAIEKGVVTVSLIQGNKGIRQTVDHATSPGIFAPVLEPIEAGKSTLHFILVTDSYADTLIISDVQVFPDLKTAQEVLDDGEAEDGSITFLKEQAWKMEFQTKIAQQKPVFESIATTGKWQIAPSNSKSAIATSNGKIIFSKANMLPGQIIKKGQAIMTINSNGFTTNNLSGELEIARADLMQAQTEYERKKELFDDKIVPQSEFEKTEQKYEIAKVKFETLSKGYSSSGFTARMKTIVAPISGYLKQVHISNGSFVTEGDQLFTISDSQANILEIQLGLQHSNKLRDIETIWYKTNENTWASLQDGRGSIISIDQSITETKPTISVFAQVNEPVNMAPGSFSEVRVSIGQGKSGIMVPESALMEDYGKYSVIVQLSGESFERRNVIIGRRNGNEVEIENGLAENEVVVTKGAYQVKMQAMSGQAPAHGHAH